MGSLWKWKEGNRIWYSGPGEQHGSEFPRFIYCISYIQEKALQTGASIDQILTHAPYPPIFLQEKPPMPKAWKEGGKRQNPLVNAHPLFFFFFLLHWISFEHLSKSVGRVCLSLILNPLFCLINLHVYSSTNTTEYMLLYYCGCSEYLVV